MRHRESDRLNDWQNQAQIAESLANGANGALRIVSNQFIFLLVVCSFVFIAILPLTQEDLLRGSVSFTLPLFQANISLKPFLWFAPWVIVVWHFYLLIQLRMALPKVRALNHEFRKIFPNGNKELRQYLHNVPLAQLALGFWREDNVTHFSLHVISLLALVFFPGITLLVMELRFLDFHGNGILPSQVSAQILDLVLVLFFWPRIMLAEYDETTSGESLNDRSIKKRIRALGNLLWRAFPDLLRTTEGPWIMFFGFLLLFFTAVPPFWAPQEWRTLQLEDKILTKGEGNAAQELVNRIRAGEHPKVWRELALKVGGVDLRGRDLRGANLQRAKLPNAILTDAKLQGANLTEAKLPWAELNGAKMQGATLTGATLYEAKLNSAELDGSEAANIDLTGAEMKNAALVDANWRGARLDGAKLDSLKATGADLEGASLKNAHLTGATLEGAALSNATLHGAVIDGDANLEKADLRFAKMVATDLSGASLEQAMLSGADLRGAILRGATFDDGTDFQRADLTGADLRDTILGPVKLTAAKLGLADLRGAAMLRPPLTELERETLGLTIEEQRIWKERPCRMREGNKEDADCLAKWQTQIPPERLCLMTVAWGPCLGEEDLATYDERLATFLAGTACEDPANGRALIRRFGRAGKEEPQRPLAALLGQRLAEAACPEVACLPVKVWKPLEKYRTGRTAPERTACPD